MGQTKLFLDTLAKPFFSNRLEYLNARVYLEPIISFI